MRHRSIIALLAVVACGRPPQAATQTGAPAPPAAQDTSGADTTVEGTVRVVGPAETAQVILSASTSSATTVSVGLSGPLAGELRRLSGATVRATGTPQNNATPPPLRAVAVRDYEILKVDGRRPVVGILSSRGDGFWLTGQDTVELVGVTSDLARLPGAKLYVVGVPEGKALRIRSYGVIRQPQ